MTSYMHSDRMSSQFGLLVLLFVVLFHLGECCDVRLSAVEHQRATEAIQAFLDDGYDIIQMNFDASNYSIDIPNHENDHFASYDLDDARNIYGLFIYFFVTDIGKTILEYPVNAEFLPSLDILGRKKTRMGVPLEILSKNCSFISFKEAIVQNIVLPLKSGIKSTRGNYVCNYDLSQLFDSTFPYGMYLPYATFNIWDTVCYNTKNETFVVEQAFANQLLFGIATILMYTFPLVLHALPDLPDRDTSEYHRYDTPYSFTMWWKIFLYGKSREQSLDENFASIINCRYILSYDRFFDFVDYISPILRMISIICLMPFVITSILEYIYKPIEDSVQSKLLNSIAVYTRQTPTLIIILECCFILGMAIIYSFYSKSVDQWLHNHLRMRAMYFLVFNNKCEGCKCCSFINLFKPRSEEILQLNPHIHTQYMSLIENSLLSLSFWKLVLKQTLGGSALQCASDETIQDASDENSLLLQGDVEKCFKSPACITCIKLACFIPFKIVQGILIILRNFCNVLLLFLNILIITLQCNPLISAPINMCHDLFLLFKKRKLFEETGIMFCVIVLWFGLILLLIFPLTITVFVLLSISLIGAIQLISQTIILTFFVGAPLYPAYVYPRLALGIALVRLLANIWLSFQQENKIVLQQIFNQLEKYNPRPDCIPKHVFHRIYADIGGTGKVTYLIKTALSIALFHVAYSVGSPHMDDKNFLNIGQALLLYFTPDFFQQLFGLDYKSKEELLKLKIKLYIEKHKGDIVEQLGGNTIELRTRGNSI